ncbi:MAG TPA: RHS repeat-associated core domain-containing protein [Blastocatellia bacterium]|nr:RHS repeat-associated core domain-containing protein [Blastocatellia bacterium]
MAEQEGGTWHDYIYLGSRLIADVTSSTATYHHADRMSTRLTTDSSGNVVSRQQTAPLGEVQTDTSSSATKRKFASYDHDSESGNDYAINREHMSTAGRFTQPDPAGMMAVALGNPQSLNLYTYTLNDPVNLADPTGLTPDNPTPDPNTLFGGTIGNPFWYFRNPPDISLYDVENHNWSGPSSGDGNGTGDIGFGDLGGGDGLPALCNPKDNPDCAEPHGPMVGPEPGTPDQGQKKTMDEAMAEFKRCNDENLKTYKDAVKDLFDGNTFIIAEWLGALTASGSIIVGVIAAASNPEIIAAAVITGGIAFISGYGGDAETWRREAQHYDQRQALCVAVRNKWMKANGQVVPTP